MSVSNKLISRMQILKLADLVLAIHLHDENEAKGGGVGVECSLKDSEVPVSSPGEDSVFTLIF